MSYIPTRRIFILSVALAVLTIAILAGCALDPVAPAPTPPPPTATPLPRGGNLLVRLADDLPDLRPGLAAQQLFTGVLVGLIVAITYHLIAVIYMLSVHTLFRIGVKDERPLWERAQRR